MQYCSEFVEPIFSSLRLGNSVPSKETSQQWQADHKTARFDRPVIWTSDLPLYRPKRYCYLIIITKGYCYSSVNNHEKSFQFLNLCISHCSTIYKPSKLLRNLLLLGLARWPEPQREIWSGYENWYWALLPRPENFVNNYYLFRMKIILFVWLRLEVISCLIPKTNITINLRF